ncbi:metalloregulator ArsR/SmtB family transcription factor [Paenibacillus sp. MMS20-IR301]|uniref:ArsR/SmtB family transcription factor n=1 Tax=Paenibacillus sp. MMS20-IR301 TaxID=2895946 RepID=UPI0028E3500B|nr:metalloregulator ArsR/SmtB family transcription factor [Paenibacillus sp. MMS20-IR301]WNS40798.1 metalloregulator ArsR/SmtB family transcription factor [Paenibacillus sp. MMS20-IR301]
MDSNFAQFDEVSDLLKALAHPVRLCIVKGLLQKGSCNVGYMQECLHLPQSTVSQHLQKLRSSGIVKTERNGLEVNYTIADARVKQLIQVFFEEDQS